jgi:hypothetical protein
LSGTPDRSRRRHTALWGDQFLGRAKERRTVCTKSAAAAGMTRPAGVRQGRGMEEKLEAGEGTRAKAAAAKAAGEVEAAGTALTEKTASEAAEAAAAAPAAESVGGAVEADGSAV